MRSLFALALVTLMGMAGLAGAQDPNAGGNLPPAAPGLEKGQKWVFMMTNFGKPEQTQVTIDLMKRAKKVGYNGMLVTDVKMDKFQLMGDDYIANVQKFRKACTDEGMKMVVGVTPFGYADFMLSNDPNLAEGMPVREATFVVKDGKLVPFDETKLVNGSFEEWKNNSPVGWNPDDPGKISFKDDAVAKDGKASVRQQDVPSGSRNRVIQKIAVKPWHYYHVSAWIKTENNKSKDWRIFGYDGSKPLNWQQPVPKETQDWTQYHATFCSLDNTELSLYVGSWNPKPDGKVWIDDVKIEPGGFVNVIRRDSCPLKVTSLDKAIVYEEGKDFSKVEDKKLLHDPYPGYFTTWHDAPVVTMPAGSKLKEGDKVLASYHFATTCGKPNNINMCMSEPKTYEIVQKQIEWVKKNVQPDAYMLSHDEIRLNGWDDTCVKTGKTNGQILADNVARCIAIVKKTDPGKTILVWNDMFDPHHNAADKDKDGKPFVMYMVKGNWSGAWEGVSKDVVVANWRQNNADSLKFFADRGNQQILAGYYDADPKRIVPWLEMAAKVNGVVGVCYTTWVHDYKKIEEFVDHVKKFEGGAK